MNYANLDLLISSIYRYQSSGEIDVPSLFGPRFERLNVFYSSPEYYTKWKHKETFRRSVDMTQEEKDVSIQWSVKSDDFFPYSDCPHCFWTGYFTSRTGFKRLERVGSSFLQAARQIESMKDFKGEVGLDDCRCKEPLYRLDDAMGVVQHHDAVSGTAKQHVAYDYAKRVQAGIDHAAKSVTNKLKRILLEDAAGEHLGDLELCQLLNETKCNVSAQATGKDLYVVVYNGLAKQRPAIISLPISADIMQRAEDVDVIVQQLGSNETVKGSVSLQDGSAILYFSTGPLPPVGGTVFRISFVNDLLEDSASSLVRRSMMKRQYSGSDIRFDGDKADISNGILSVRFDRCVFLTSRCWISCLLVCL